MHLWACVLLLPAGSGFAQLSDAEPPVLTVTTSNVLFTTSSNLVIQGTATDDVSLKNLRVFVGTAGAGYTTLTNLTFPNPTRTTNWAVSLTLTQGMNYFLLQLYDHVNKSQCDISSFNPNLLMASCCQFYAVYYPTNVTGIPFENWRLAHFTPAELTNALISGPDADPDGDSLVNLLEYAWSRDPKSAASNGSGTLTPGTGQFAGQRYFTVNYVHDRNAVDLIYTPAISYSLTSSWSSSLDVAQPVFTEATNDVVFQQFRSTEPITNRAQMFGRVGVSKRPIPSLSSLFPELSLHCQTCHSASGSSTIPWFEGETYANFYANLMMGAKTAENRRMVAPGFPEFSELYLRIASTDPSYRMPYMGLPLPAVVVEKIKLWIQGGAPLYGVYLTAVVGSGSGAVQVPNRIFDANNSIECDIGESLELSAVPSPGWRFSHWSYDATGTNNPLTVVVATNKFIAANFARLPTLTTSTNGNGAVVRNPDLTSYPFNSTVTLTAVPGAGWGFTGWSGDTNGTQNPLTIVMTTNKFITANFTRPSPPGVIAQWDFNSVTPDANTATGTTAPVYGSGTASTVGGTSQTFASGDTTADPAGTTDNSAWEIRDFPGSTTSNKTAGAQFNVSTVGYNNIRVTWQQSSAGQASKYARLQYTTNGSDFVDFPTSVSMNSGGFETKSNSLAGIPAVNNRFSFGFRIVTEFESTATGSGLPRYVPRTGGSYSSSAPVDFDMVTVYGDPDN